MIKIEHANLTIGGKHILNDVNFEVRQGEFVCLVGESGGGKTSVLKLISGLYKPSSGTIHTEGQVSMVFQDFALMPWLSVIQNIEFPFKVAGQPADSKKVQQVINEIGLRGLEHKYPRDLSGGQNQRVGIARALVVNREILLMDEPFSALDIKTEAELRDDVLKLWNSRKLTVVMVSHSVEGAVAMADRILVMEKGNIRKEIPVQLNRPREANDTQYLKFVDHIKEIIEH
ncbi:ABC transporter ATP-binding protein [Patescibacteria group bacterium]|nr:ABC transporter ATP-binding protein [Patescibacteria group bacterium]